MSSIVISGDTSGAITLAAPSVAGTNTATLPAATGTMMVSGNMPAFSAFSSSTTSFTANTFTKVPLQTKNFDTNSNFDNVTNYRFTPTVSGYYQFNGYLSFSSALQVMQLAFYKNGSSVGFPLQLGSASGGYINQIIYMNGSTDYIELWGLTGSTQNCSGAFNGSLIRTS